MQTLADIDFVSLTQGPFHPSPAAWEDQVFYFFLLDRFSDGNEMGVLDNDGNPVAGTTTPPLREIDHGNAVRTEIDAAHWREAGARFVGGTLRGAMSKIGYLKRLGITALWVSPVFKQPVWSHAYHGYGVQDFLEIDPRFGTREDLRALVSTAHAHGIHVILDVILNHAGPVFSYDADRYPTEGGMDPRWDGRDYTVKGWNDATGQPSLPLDQPVADPNAAIWPLELQSTDHFTRRGRINSWDWYPEFVEGDFFDLKDIQLGQGAIDHFRISPALKALTRIYQYWIAYADLDGFRVDTVKHMEPGATRYFTACIHEFAQSIGKEQFTLIGEITGGRGNAFALREATGLDAALGIDDIPDKLEYLAKGQRNPSEYFCLFRNSFEIGKDSHTWFRNKVVTLYDDHDQVRKGENKARFCAGGGASHALNVLALNTLTLGIPCIYYGSEQELDGSGGNDRYIREALFGGDFGAFRSAGRHCFDENHPLYLQLAKLLRVRSQHMALRRGRQYLRAISGNGQDFGEPHMIGGSLRSIVAWSRLFTDREWVCAINTDEHAERAAWVGLDQELNPTGNRLVCLYASDAAQIGIERLVESPNPDWRAIWLSLPAAGCAIFGPAD
ncbi:MAG: alpha-amylase family glycosyl hydrolase [Thiobacillus sp.]|nr:alpha-amylase family glycosyl hydrolase [Thiobacillus sp.]